jgi:hypothetical protein
MRYLTDNYAAHDPRALLNVEKMAALCETAIPLKQYITPTGTDTLQIEPGMIFSVGGVSVIKTDATPLTVANLDTGSAFEVGKDYCIYVCDPGGDGNEQYAISKNSTYPIGWGALNSRKIGGFHYGKCRKVNNAFDPLNAGGAVSGSGWESAVFNSIVPASVWTLAHRPKCDPSGMVYLSSGTWVDIYLSSDNGAGGLRSAFDAMPITGTEGLDWFQFSKRAMVVGKRLLTVSEWNEAAYGSPQGLDANNTNAWAATTNTTRTKTGAVINAVSSIGCRDCVGNVWEWLDEHFNVDGATATANVWTDVVGAGNGKVFMGMATAWHTMIAGGYWSNGVVTGCRCFGLIYYPWFVTATIGSRCGCDSL